MSRQKMFIPTFISNADFESARVRPRVFFYNGQVETNGYVLGGKNDPNGQSSNYQKNTLFPYIDHFSSGSSASTFNNRFPDANSESLLYFNETPAYGEEQPTGSLYTNYWSKYVALLYNPKTRLIECSAVLPFADYVNLELNDIIEWRGNHYHLRAINKYNLKTGECEIQLLGPIIQDALDNQYT